MSTDHIPYAFLKKQILFIYEHICIHSVMINFDSTTSVPGGMVLTMSVFESNTFSAQT